jgi:hypothetical protein
VLQYVEEERTLCAQVQQTVEQAFYHRHRRGLITCAFFKDLRPHSPHEVKQIFDPMQLEDRTLQLREVGELAASFFADYSIDDAGRSERMLGSYKG